MTDNHGDVPLAAPEDSSNTWYQKYILTWRVHRRNSQWNIPQGIAVRKQSFVTKTMPVYGLLMTTILSSFLLYGINQPPFIDHSFYNFISEHRSSVQAILSLLASVFGFAHLYVFTSVINFSTRILLMQYAPSLDRLKWWKALATKSIDLTLPLGFLLPVIAVFALTLLPAFLWTGALTPNLVSRDGSYFSELLIL